MTGDEAKKIINDAMDRISALMAMEKWKEAHRACLEILRFDPENLKVIRIKNKIEKIVSKINIRTLKDDVAKLEPLWKEKNYEALVENLKRLEPFAADYPKIRKQYILAQKKYHAQLLEQQEGYVMSEIARMKALAGTHNYQDAVKIAEKLRIYKTHEDDIRSVLKTIRKQWIEHELETHKGLTGSEKYEDILLFYQGLLHIDSKYEKVRKLLEKAKKSYQTYKIGQKREFIYKQMDKIKTLYQMKRYEQAMNLAEELLEIDPLNKESRFYFKKAKRKAEKIADREIYEQMKKSREEIGEEIKKDRSGVVKM
jgi:tetratricopeptide (TPR) repeat protein